MKLKFLGTCGGRTATSKQLRQTGGIILSSKEAKIHIDPGPGALVHLNKQIKDPEKIDAVLVTHAHLDHYSDSEALIELITQSSNKPGALFANKTSLEGSGSQEKAISSYHQNLCQRVELLEEGEKIEYKDLQITSQKMFHSDPHTIGFKIENKEGKKYGFWTDTKYSSELTSFYQDCKTLIVNSTLPHGHPTRKHTNLDDVVKIDKQINPKNIILTHFGHSLLKSNISEEKKWIKDKTSSKIVFAEDNMSFPGNKSLESF